MPLGRSMFSMTPISDHTLFIYGGLGADGNTLSKFWPLNKYQSQMLLRLSQRVQVFMLCGGFASLCDRLSWLSNKKYWVTLRWCPGLGARSVISPLLLPWTSVPKVEEPFLFCLMQLLKQRTSWLLKWVVFPKEWNLCFNFFYFLSLTSFYQTTPGSLTRKRESGPRWHTHTRTSPGS